MSARERAARRLCERIGIDPDALEAFDDKHGIAFGNTQGIEKRPLWMNQLRTVDAVLDALLMPTDAMIEQITGDRGAETALMRQIGVAGYVILINAAKDGK